MNIKIGAIIKKLRQENNVTQDTLATAIGVTPQAISRWEAEGGYPDIELLPALADFFSKSCQRRAKKAALSLFFRGFVFDKYFSVCYNEDKIKRRRVWR